MTMTIEQLRRKLRLPFNVNPSFDEMKAHGIEPPKRPLIAPKAPPSPPNRGCNCCCRCKS